VTTGENAASVTDISKGILMVSVACSTTVDRCDNGTMLASVACQFFLGQM
jgi:hypothetical protein